MSQLNYETIHVSLVAAVPEFKASIDEHVSDNFGEVLPHLLFGDLTRFVLAQRQQGSHEVVSRILEFLEDASHSTDPLTVNLVAVSFVENVGPWEPGMREFIDQWPPGLQGIASEQGWQDRC